MAEQGWFVEVYGDCRIWRKIAGKVARSGARVIVDHFGHPDTRLGLDQEGFGDVLALGRGGDAVVKLSSVFRVSRAPFPHRDVDPFIAAILEAFGPNRVVWGSDWPFLNASQTVRFAEQASCLARWVPDERHCRRILADNPARLFGFTAASGERRDGVGAAR
jgi:predicted TIM-barrel fold metal-dependent hydrolase